MIIRIFSSSEPIKNEIQNNKNKMYLFSSWPESNIDENKINTQLKLSTKIKTCRIMFTGNIVRNLPIN